MSQSLLIPISDAQVASMPVVECGENLVAIEGLHKTIVVDDSVGNQAHLGYQPTFLVREGVALRLLRVAEQLPSACCLIVKESLRPAALQAAWFERRLRRISAENPSLTHEAAVELTSHFIAPPWVAGHPSGGAIDVTLGTRDGLELDMGCGYDEDEATSNGACVSDFDDLTTEARERRVVLFGALLAADFVNYPFEWWHWSYGDRYWAVIKQQPYAIYGPVQESL